MSDSFTGARKSEMSKSKVRDVYSRLLSQSLKDRFLVEVAHRCCLCPEHEDITEIHHIVGEKGKYTPAQLKMYEKKWIERCKAESRSPGKSAALIPEVKIKQIITEKIHVRLRIHSLGQTWDIPLPWDIRTADIARHLSQKLGLEGVRTGNRHQ